jgi:maleamate amidohydrolase
MRIWDRFLTESDRAWVATRRKSPVGFGRKAALLMIDLYRGGFGDRPLPLAESVREWPWSCGLHGWNALPHITSLLAQARKAGLPVVHSTMRRSDDGLLGWMDFLHGSAGSLSSGEKATAAKEIVPEARPLPGEAVIEKSAPSAFWGTPLIAHLRQLDVDTVLVAGMATSGCVRASVIDGVANRLRMIVVEECVFDRIEASHALSLFDIEQKYGDVVPLSDALGWIAGRN